MAIMPVVHGVAAGEPPVWDYCSVKSRGRVDGAVLTGTPGCVTIYMDTCPQEILYRTIVHLSRGESSERRISLLPVAIWPS